MWAVTLIVRHLYVIIISPVPIDSPELREDFEINLQEFAQRLRDKKDPEPEFVIQFLMSLERARLNPNFIINKLVYLISQIWREP